MTTMVWSLIAKATVLMAMGLAAAWMARRERAAVRHAVLAAAFGAIALLPMASVLAPAVNVPVGRVTQAGPAAAIVSGSAVQKAQIPTKPPVDWVLVVWVSGMMLFLAPLLVGLWQTRRWRRNALPWREGQELADELAGDAGIRRRVEVLLHSEAAGPVTFGSAHPAIVLPQGAQAWNGEEVRRALVHEMEHVRRWDRVTLCWARAVCAAYWFHPLAWMAWRRLALEAERACDDAVLARSEATAYADQLVELARSLKGRAPAPAMASPADLATRVRAVLDARQQRGRAGRWAIGAACAGAVVFAGAVGPLRMVAAQSQSNGVRFRAQSELVVINVMAKDQNGNPITGLTAKDFSLTEDGVAQSIVLCEFQTVMNPQNLPESYYILGYYTQNDRADGKFRQMKVTVQGMPDAMLQFRQGYYANRPVASVGSAFTFGKAEPGVKPPVLVYKKEPEYSEEARKAKYQGTVLLYVEIGTDGHVGAVRVVRSLGLGLDEKAIEAVKQWKFRPAMKNGSAIPMATEVEVQFRLL